MKRSFSTKEKELLIKKYNSTKNKSLFFDHYFNHPMLKGKFKTSKQFKEARYRFRKLVLKYNMYGKAGVTSMTGKSKGNGKGRPRKEKPITWDDFTKEELIEIAKEYQRIQDEIAKEKKKEGISNLSFSLRKKSYVSGLARNTISNFKSKKYKINILDEYDIAIRGIFEENHKIIGRDKICALLSNLGLDMSPRNIGYRMTKMGLKPLQRQPRRAKEQKMLDANANDHVKRDYNGKNGNYIFTDVSYIPYGTGSYEHFYLSAALDAKTKKILSFEISDINDVNLVMSHFRPIEIAEGTVIHSDRGYQYFSTQFTNFCEEKNLVRSVGRKGNCLDNREIEYWFSCLKSEWLSKYNTIGKSLQEVKNIIKEYVQWYNNKRIQSNLDWKTPNQVERSIKMCGSIFFA